MHRCAKSRRSSCEGGFTIPELAVAATVLLIVAAAVLAFIVVSAGQHLNQEDRVATTDEARNALLGVTSELRDAQGVSFVDSHTVQAEIRTSTGELHQVTYTCGTPGAESASCIRTDATTGEEELLVEGVVNTDPFRLVRGSDVTATTTEGGTIELTLELELDEADNPIGLTSAVTPRNCSSSAGVINPCT